MLDDVPFLLESPLPERKVVAKGPQDLFPAREWRPLLDLESGACVSRSTRGDVVLTSYRIVDNHVSRRGATVMVSPFEVYPGAQGCWIRARHYSTSPFTIVVDWNVRNRDEREVEMRTTGYNDALADLVCSCIRTTSQAYRTIVDVVPEYAAFAAAARRTVAEEIRSKALPSRLGKNLA